MRRPAAFLPLPLALVVLTGCTELQIDTPQIDPVRESAQWDLDYPPSELSHEDPLLCLDGERDGADCTEQGELRWSIPLEEGHGGDFYVRTDTLGGWDLTSVRDGVLGAAEHGVHEIDGMLLHAEDDFLRAVDPETGEPLWTSDLRDGWLGQTTGLYDFEPYLLAGLRGSDDGMRRPAELVLLEPEDGTEVARHRTEGRVLAADAEEGSVLVSVSEHDYHAEDPLTGERIWEIGVPEPSSAEEESRVQWAVEDGVLYLAQQVLVSEEQWQVDSVQAFDTGSGEELSDPFPDLEDTAEIDDLPLEFESSDAESAVSAMSSEPEFDYRGGDLRQAPILEHPGESEGALAGLAMVTTTLGVVEGGPVIGAACAPDAVRAQEPPADALSSALHCDRPRLFAVSG